MLRDDVIFNSSQRHLFQVSVTSLINFAEIKYTHQFQVRQYVSTAACYVFYMRVRNDRKEHMFTAVTTFNNDSYKDNQVSERAK